MEWKKKLFNTSYRSEADFIEPVFHAYQIDNRIFDPNQQMKSLEQAVPSDDADLQEMYDNYQLDYGKSFHEPLFMKLGEKHLVIGRLIADETNDSAVDYFSMPRELMLQEGRLIQKPYIHLEDIRAEAERALGYATKKNVRLQPYDGRCYELVVDILENEASEFYLELRASKKESTVLTYNNGSQVFTLDTSESSPIINTEGTRSSVLLNEPLRKIHAFVDESSIEIFLNDGIAVMSARMFPSPNSTQIKTSTESGQVFLQFTKNILK